MVASLAALSGLTGYQSALGGATNIASMLGALGNPFATLPQAAASTAPMVASMGGGWNGWNPQPAAPSVQMGGGGNDIWQGMMGAPPAPMAAPPAGNAIVNRWNPNVGGGRGGWVSEVPGQAQSLAQWTMAYNDAQKARQRQEAARAQARGAAQEAIASYQAAFNQARAANEARYGQLLSETDKQLADYTTSGNSLLDAFKQRQTSVLDLMQGLGDTEREATRRRFAGLAAQQQQAAVGRGLGNTTYRDAIARATALDESFAQQAIDEAARREKASALTALSGDTLAYNQRFNDMIDSIRQRKTGIMERRTDAYPDSGLLAAQIAAAQI